MRIVSFDTSGNNVYLSLLEQDQVVDEQLVEGHPTDRKEVGGLLMPQLDSAVKRLGWKKSAIDLIVVGTGPGSFTGIRVAVITGRTLAQALNVGLIGMSGLETAYYGVARGRPAAVVQSTTAKQFFYGAFETRSDEPAFAIVPAGCGGLIDVSQALDRVPEWLGDESFVAQSTDARTHLLLLTKNIASLQAQLAVDRLSLKGLLSDGGSARARLKETFPWQNVLPLYLRNPSVTVKKSYAT